jgi:Fe-S-cluster-containing dehydrogenase component
MEERRSFLKKSGLVILGLATVGLGQSKKNAMAATTAKVAMIIDLNRCLGCQSCVIACKQHNQTTSGFFNTRIELREKGTFPTARMSFTPKLCNQCEQAPCVRACSTGATFQLANGIVVTDWAQCIGDGACVTACPYNARFLDPESENKADKCDFCIGRLEKGLEPACVDACPAHARIFGDLNNPQGDFATYLQQKKLSPPDKDIDTGTRVFYTVSDK